MTAVIEISAHDNPVASMAFGACLLAAAWLAWKFHDSYYRRVSKFWGFGERLSTPRLIRNVSRLSGVTFLGLAGTFVILATLVDHLT